MIDGTRSYYSKEVNNQQKVIVQKSAVKTMIATFFTIGEGNGVYVQTEKAIL